MNYKKTDELPYEKKYIPLYVKGGNTFDYRFRGERIEFLSRKEVEMFLANKSEKERFFIEEKTIASIYSKH